MAVLAVVVATTGAAAGTAQAMPTHVQGGGTGTTVTDVHDMPADSMIASQSLSEPAGPDGVSGHHLRGPGLSAERRNGRP